MERGPTWGLTFDERVSHMLDQMLARGDAAGLEIDAHTRDLLRQWNDLPPRDRRTTLRGSKYKLKPFDTPACKREGVLEAYVGSPKGSSRTHRIYLVPYEVRRELRYFHLASKDGNAKAQRSDAETAAQRASRYRDGWEGDSHDE